jgi:hypothetical protein
LSVVVAGCGGNDTSESAVTKNAKVSSSDGGAGGGATKSDTKTSSSDGGAGGGSTKSAPTTIAKTGSADGGTGESVTVSDSELLSRSLTSIRSGYEVTLTPVQMNALPRRNGKRSTVIYRPHKLHLFRQRQLRTLQRSR